LSAAKSLQEVGHDVLVLTTDACGSGRLDVPLNVATTYEGVPVVYFQRRLLKPYFYVPDLVAALRRMAQDCDICLIKGHWTYINVAVSSLLASLNVPFCMYPEGTLDPWAMQYRGVKKTLYWYLVEKYNYRRASGFIAASANEERQLREHGLTQPTVIIPNAVSRSEFSAPRSGNAERYFPALAKRKVLLFMSRLHPKKGLDLLLRAFPQVRDAVPDALLVVVGSGDPAYESYIHGLVGELNIQSHVLFVGTLTGEKVISLIHYAHVFVLPSHSEGMPMAVQNALACGVPVIISRFCNMPEVKRYGAGIELEDVNDRDELASAMIGVLHEDASRTSMGLSAVHLVDDLYSFESVGRKMAGFCAGLISDRCRHRSARRLPYPSAAQRAPAMESRSSDCR
jgi:glycosyltransferase involved in cell wall biosynthesis